MKETEMADKAEELEGAGRPKRGIEVGEKRLTEAKAIRYAVYVDLMAINNQDHRICNNKWDR